MKDSLYEEAVEKDREKYIVSELTNLQKIAERQATLRNELLARLAPVTLQELPSTDEKQPSESLGVPLADDLSVVSRNLATTNAVIEDILNRLEI